MFKSLIEKDNRMKNIVAGDIMIKNIEVLSPDMHIEDAAKILSNSKEIALPVVMNGTVVGILSEKDCIRFLYELDKYENPYSFVRTYMTQNVRLVSVNNSLHEIISFFVKMPYKSYPVVEKGTFVGMLYRRNIIPYTEMIRRDFLENN